MLAIAMLRYRPHRARRARAQLVACEALLRSPSATGPAERESVPRTGQQRLLRASRARESPRVARQPREDCTRTARSGRWTCIDFRPRTRSSCDTPAVDHVAPSRPCLPSSYARSGAHSRPAPHQCLRRARPCWRRCPPSRERRPSARRAIFEPAPVPSGGKHDLGQRERMLGSTGLSRPRRRCRPACAALRRQRAPRHWRDTERARYLPDRCAPDDAGAPVEHLPAQVGHRDRDVRGAGLRRRGCGRRRPRKVQHDRPPPAERLCGPASLTRPVGSSESIDFDTVERDRSARLGFRCARSRAPPDCGAGTESASGRARNLGAARRDGCRRVWRSLRGARNARASYQEVEVAVDIRRRRRPR